MKHRIGLWLSAVIALWAARASADENYMATQATTTVAARSEMGSFDGPQRDATVGIGVGRVARRSYFVELDASATFVDGAGPEIALAPGIGWAFLPSFYAVARTTVPVEHPIDITLAPGVGALRALDDTIKVFAELNLVGAWTLDDRDVGLALTLGATVRL